MREAAFAAVVVAACAAAVAVTADRARASCVESVRWRGNLYVGWPTKRSVPLGPKLRGGVVPGCHDTPDEPPPPARPVALRAVAAIAPRAVVARPGRARRVFLADGVLPQLREFPLHDAIYGSHARPDERTWEQPPGKRRFRCDRVVRRVVSGRVVNALFGVRVRTAEREESFFVDVRTRMLNARSRVRPLPRGTQIRAELTECRRGTRFRYPVAEVIEVRRS